MFFLKLDYLTARHEKSEVFKTQYAGKVNNITLDKCSKMGLVFQVI